MSINNFSNREKKLALITLAVVMGALTFNFALLPVISGWSYLNKTVSDREAVLTKYARILSDKDEIEELGGLYSKYYVKQISPDEENAIALSAIEKIANNAGVIITNIKPLSFKSEEYYRKATFRVMTESTLEGLSKFIYDMQLSDQLLKVERMVLRAKENAPSTIKSVLNI